MSKKLYLISGIPCIATECSREFRQDLKLFKENDREVTARIGLTRFQALIARVQIMHYNLTHPYCMRITRMKGRRFRV